MNDLNWWDIGIVGVATYLAVTLMVRLMLMRRNEVIAELNEEIAQERQRQRKNKTRDRKSTGARPGEAA